MPDRLQAAAKAMTSAVAAALGDGPGHRLHTRTVMQGHIRVLYCERCGAMVAELRTMVPMGEPQDQEPEHCPGCLQLVREAAAELERVINENAAAGTAA